MTNYVKQTWTDGVSSASAARLGVMEDGIFDAHFPPCARVTHSAVQSIANATQTALAFDTERFDNDTIHDTATNNSRLTCKTAGKYLIGGNLEFVPGGGTFRGCYIRLNGTNLIGVVTMPLTAAADVLAVTTIWDLAVNDYVELIAHQTSGGALNANRGLSYSPEFWMVRVA